MLPFEENRSIRLSAFAHTYSRKDIAATVHSLSHTPVYYDLKLLPIVESLKRPTAWKKIQKQLGSLTDMEGAVELLKQLVEAKLLVPEEYNEQSYLDNVRSKLIIGPHFDILFLLLTDTCNLKCTYCFIEGSKPSGYNSSVMTKEIARAAIDAFIRWKAPSGDKSIVFYGGEPLCNVNVFLSTLEYIDQQIDIGNW